MAIRVRKIKNKNATGGFSYVALCAATHKAKKGDIYLDDSVDFALRRKFLEDYTEEGLVRKSQKEISLKGAKMSAGNRADVFSRLRDFLEQCNELEKARLYAVFSALRGPDEDAHTMGIKQIFTCKIREILGFKTLLSVWSLKTLGAKELAEQLKYAGGHWGGHVLIALEKLEKAKLISSKYAKFLLKIRKEAARREEK